MKKLFFLLSIICFIGIYEAEAQTKSKSSRKPSSSRSSSKKKSNEGENFWTEKMMYGGFVNWPQFGGGIFNVSLSPMIGYKFTNFMTAGLLLKGNYTWVRAEYFGLNGEEPFNLFEPGIGGFARVKIANILFLHGEYETTKYAIDADYDDQGKRFIIKEDQPTLNVGVGYIQGMGKWKSELGIYYNTLYDDQVSFKKNPFDFRFALTYNF